MKKYILIILGFTLLIPHFICYFIVSKKKRNIIYEDIIFWSEHKKINDRFVNLFILLLIKFPELRSVFYYRLGRYLNCFCSWYLPGRKNLFIWTKNIGAGLYIGHGWGTVINAKSIGYRCKVYQNVTIGSRNNKEPVIGNDVTIAAHAVVLGGISVGDNTNIGAGAVVIRNINSNTTVIPAKSLIVRENGLRVLREV